MAVKSEEIRCLLKAGKEREPIRIKSERIEPGCVIRIKITPDALEVLKKLEKQTGQPWRYLASELIVQGARNVLVIPEACADCEYAESCEIESKCRKG